MFNGESRARKLYGGNEEEEKEEAVRGDSISSGARTARILLRTVESASSAFAARRDITLCVTLLQEGEGGLSARAWPRRTHARLRMRHSAPFDVGL